MRPRRRLAAAAMLACLCALTAAVGVLGAPRERFDTEVLSLIPRPGFPAHAYVSPQKRVYEGTYTNPSGDSVPSRVFEFSKQGVLLRSWTVEGQNLSADHGVQAATSDSRGRLVLLDKAPARVLLLNLRNGRQRPYASFPSAATPNYAAWGRRGELYVSDYQHPVLWRIPPGGGEAEPWLEDPRLDGGEVGSTGLELAADRRHLLLATQSSSGGGDGDPATGKLYEIEIGADRQPGEIRTLWESRPLDGPDGFGLARSGNIYMTLLLANQIAVIDPSGDEIERFPDSPLAAGENGSAIPFDNPSSAAFLGRRLMIANQSFVNGDPTHQAILDVSVGERGHSELIPKRAGVKRRR